MGNYVLQIAKYKLITHYQLSIELPQESVADAMNTERCVMKKKYLMCALVSIALLRALAAQDSFFDDAGGIVPDSAETNFSSAETDTNGVMNSASMGKSEKILEWHGFAKLDARLWVHPDVKRADAIPVFGLTVSHSSPKTELSADLQLNVRTVKDYPLDILNELTMRAYLGDCVLSAGKLKLVWGKGDMIHVLDVFNANDLTDFTIPAYIDRRIGEPMVHFAYNAPIPLRLELAWAPSMTPDRIALSGPWVPPQITEIKRISSSIFFDDKTVDLFPTQKIENLMYTTIESTLTTITTPPANITVYFPILSDEEINQITSSFPSIQKPIVKALLKSLSGKPITVDISGTLSQDKIKEIAKTESKKYAKYITEEFKTSLKKVGAIIENFRFDEFVKIGMNAFLPDMHNIKYGQYGIRLSGSAGPVDMAGQYYFGHYKTPSIDVDAMVTNALAGKSLADCVHYDPVHIFGIDLGTAIAMFNLKSEFAYYMTGDFKGTDPAVHNNSIQWVMGFDVDIPLNNINVNIQNLGAWTLGFKKVKENNENGKFDMDWNTAEKSTNNKLIVNISDSWLHENLTDSLTCIWGIEHNDFVIIPKLRYRIKDELYVEGTGAYIYAANKKSEFSNWKNNHFVQASLEYRF